MILGIDVNYLIELAAIICGGYLLIFLGVLIFMGFGAAKKFLHYTWFLVPIIFGILAFTTKKKKDPRLENIDNKIEELHQIENKTKEDEAKLKQLEEQKKKIEDDIQQTTNKAKEDLDKLKDKPSKSDDVTPGSAGKSSDDLNKVW